MARILLVEDEIMLRYVLGEWLRTEGYEVAEAVSADEALEVLFSPIIDIDVVLTDVRMPGSMNGLELTSRIRAIKPALPVIVLSGDAFQRDAEAAGAVAFFRKPCDFDLLTARIAMLVPQRDGAANRPPAAAHEH